MSFLNLFRDASNMENFSAGQTIFEQGSEAQTMYVIIEGEVELKPNDNISITVSEGDIIGEMALIDQSTRSATAIAKTECRAAPVDENCFLFMVQKTPFFAINVMKVLADRLRQMNETYYKLNLILLRITIFH